MVERRGVFKGLYLIINMYLAQGNKKKLPIQTWKLRNTSNKDLWYGTYQILDKKFQIFTYISIQSSPSKGECNVV